MSETKEREDAPLWGVSAEFATADSMVAALESLRGSNLGRLDAFSPFPVPATFSALRLPHWHIKRFGFAGLVLGGLGMMCMCLYATVYSYPFLIGGRPLVSWPYFVVPSVSFAMLFGTLATVAGFLLLNRLPRLNHPAFNIPDFIRVTEDRFFIVIEARDDEFDADAVERRLAALAEPPRRVSRVSR
jgi:ActD protein